MATYDQRRAAASAPRTPAAASAGTIVQGGVADANRLGFFNPGGSPAIRAALQRRARRSAEVARRRAGLAGKLAGLDQQAQQQNIVDTERGNAFQTTDFLNSAQENEMIGNRDYSRSLLGGRLGQEDELARIRLHGKLAKEAQGGGIGSQIGGLLGAVGGAVLGRRRGSGSGIGGPELGDPDFRYQYGGRP